MNLFSIFVAGALLCSCGSSRVSHSVKNNKTLHRFAPNSLNLLNFPYTYEECGSRKNCWAVYEHDQATQFIGHNNRYWYALSHTDDSVYILSRALSGRYYQLDTFLFGNDSWLFKRVLYNYKDEHRDGRKPFMEEYTYYKLAKDTATLSEFGFSKRNLPEQFAQEARAVFRNINNILNNDSIYRRIEQISFTNRALFMNRYMEELFNWGG